MPTIKYMFLRTIRLFTAALLLVTVPLSIQAQSAMKIEDRMTAAELLSTGLGNLNAAQLEALNQWVQRNLSGNTVNLSSAPANIPENEITDMTIGNTSVEQEDSKSGLADVSGTESRGYGEREKFVEVTSLINGSFTGWSGTTVFELENGQVYLQRRQGKWRTELNNPEVRITKNFLGMLEMEVDGHSIGVKRLR